MLTQRLLTELELISKLHRESMYMQTDTLQASCPFTDGPSLGTPTVTIPGESTYPNRSPEQLVVTARSLEEGDPVI